MLLSLRVRVVIRDREDGLLLYRYLVALKLLVSLWERSNGAMNSGLLQFYIGISGAQARSQCFFIRPLNSPGLMADYLRDQH